MNDSIVRALLILALGGLGACSGSLGQAPGRPSPTASASPLGAGSARGVASARAKLKVKPLAKPQPVAAPSTSVTPFVETAPPALPGGNLGELRVDLPEARPAGFVVDGDLGEWPAGTGSRAMLVFEPNGWLLAFELRGTFLKGMRLEVKLPGEQLPGIEEGLPRGSSPPESFNCERNSVGNLRLPAEKARCQGVVARYRQLQRAHAQRFVRLYEVRTDGITVTGEGGSRRVVPKKLACKQGVEALRCEAELPLTALPRTSQALLGELTLRAGPLGSTPLLPRSGDRLGVLSPVAFEPGAALRQLLFSSPLSSSPRSYSYQPGDGLRVEIVDRVGEWHQIGDLALSRCNPEVKVGGLGDLVLGDACGTGVVFAKGKPTALFSYGAPRRILTRPDLLVVVSGSVKYSMGSHHAQWTVTAIDAEGQVRPVLLEECSSQVGARLTHNHDFSVIGCRATGENHTSDTVRQWQLGTGEVEYVELPAAKGP